MHQERKKEIWMLQTKRADFNSLAERLGVSPVSVRIMRNRDLETEEEMRKYLYGTVDALYDGNLMKDMEKAVRILMEKIEREELMKKVDRTLSPAERRVFGLSLQGKKAAEIALLLGKDKKSVENTLYRLRRKLSSPVSIR